MAGSWSGLTKDDMERITARMNFQRRAEEFVNKFITEFERDPMSLSFNSEMQEEAKQISEGLKRVC
jgi:hypothetical protein